MGKIFRIYKDGAETYQDWSDVTGYPYDSNARDSIADPEGANAKKEITSIPSPFARIDLARDAFRYVCRNNDNSLSGDTIYHKIVSDALDVGEIFFNFPKFKNKIEIIKWDPDRDINLLLKSSVPGNRCLGDVLSKYIRSDSDICNFGKMHGIFLLNYIHGPQIMNIIGATSPSTLFFSNANDLSYVSDDIVFGTHPAFGKDYEPLYLRAPEYILYWYYLRDGISDFPRLFPEVDEYLMETVKLITDSGLKNDISQRIYHADRYKEIYIGTEMTDVVEVLGYPVPSKISGTYSGSDFEIRSDVKADIMPLVLPVSGGNRYEKMKYTSSIWGNRNVAPYRDERKPEDRTLPFDGSKQPYLTITDFLEDNIMLVPHIINADDWFDPCSQTYNDSKGPKSFLPPVKPIWLKFFSADLLMSKCSDGKPVFEYEFLPDSSVKIYLRVPVKGNGETTYIEYTRTYRDDAQMKQEEDGHIVAADFTAILFPCVKTEEESESFYIFSLISTDGAGKAFTVDFYNGRTHLTDVPRSFRSKSSDFITEQNYTIERSYISAVRINIDKAGESTSGLLVPRLHKAENKRKYKFAVDIGTSFTHIEYCTSDSHTPESFAYDNTNALYSEVFIPEYRENEGRKIMWDLLDEQPVIEKDFLPFSFGVHKKDILGRDVDFSFPSPTVLSAGDLTDWGKVVYPFGDVNIPLCINRRRDLPYDKYFFGIKWGEEDSEVLLSKYIECIILMIRSAVLSWGGSIKDASIVWFYPGSMPEIRKSTLKRIWADKAAKYFLRDNTVSMPESIAPARYYFRIDASLSDMLNIDIGGGTTDIAYSVDRHLVWITSFRFAMNDIFSDTIADLNEKNGIIDFFADRMRKMLEKAGLNELVAVSESKTNRRPENMASFLFSLASNHYTRSLERSQKDFDIILANDTDFKIVFIVFFTSVIYHVALMIKLLGLRIPRHIALSGNGANVVKIIFSGNKSLAEEYVTHIFERLTSQKTNEPVGILLPQGEESPKVVTCKGGLTSDDDRDYKYSEYVMKADGSSFVKDADRYEDVDRKYIDSIVDSAKKFLDFTLVEMAEYFDFTYKMGVSAASLSEARGTSLASLRIYTEKMLKKRNASSASGRIAETAFFYPLKGWMNQLSSKIYDELKNKE